MGPYALSQRRPTNPAAQVPALRLLRGWGGVAAVRLGAAVVGLFPALRVCVT